jgi:hypothetical protein
MMKNNKIKNQVEDPDEKNCDCGDNCCPPKKNIRPKMIIFIGILLAAIGVIGFKIVNNPVPVAVKESCCPAKVTTGHDTTKNVTCDTTKGSSCCPK